MEIQKKIVIVGSGAAGLRCAIHLWENGEKHILIVGDRAFDDAHTTQARGGINAALHTMDPEDTTGNDDGKLLKERRIMGIVNKRHKAMRY